MSMIKKVFLVIAILLICLITWSLFLGNGGILENGWNGIAKQVNKTWQAVTGSDDDVMPGWKSNTNNTNTGIENMDNAGNNAATPN